MSSEFVVLIPVKPLPLAKSRLVGLAPALRIALARAFALDVVLAATAARDVVRVAVVTDDPEVAAAAHTLGAEVLPDGGGGLNAALTGAAHRVSVGCPTAVPVALLADLPALQAPDLDAALAALDPRRGGFVADAATTGTTLYGAAAEVFAPQFGVGSSLRHRELGAVEIGGTLPSLRHDVDDLAALSAARALGVGPHTAQVLTGRLDV